MDKLEKLCAKWRKEASEKLDKAKEMREKGMPDLAQSLVSESMTLLLCSLEMSATFRQSAAKDAS